MPFTRAAPARSVREEIESALTPGLSGTVRWIAAQAGLPVRVAREELAKMALEGRVRSRTHRSGEVLFRLTDRYDPRWDALRGPALTR